MQNPKDRTSEFLSILDTIRLQADTHTLDSQRLLPGNGHGSNGRSRDTKGKGRGDFSTMADKIARDIKGTGEKLDKLAMLAKRKTLFDDRPVEISELTYIIKQDIAQLNQQIAQLQDYTRTHLHHGSGGKQITEHNNNVVMMLQSRLADTSIGFKDILEIRTKNMKASRDRTEHFMYSSQSQQSYSPATDSPLYRPTSTGPELRAKSRGMDRSQTPDHLTLNLGNLGDAPGQNGLMEMQLMQQPGDEQYMHQRSTAIETIESTVAELGQIFSQLATMVAVQGEQVTRIDQDTEEIATNVSGAQTELLRYYASISSNRWLMIKVFGVLILFFLTFVLVS